MLATPRGRKGVRLSLLASTLPPRDMSLLPSPFKRALAKAVFDFCAATGGAFEVEGAGAARRDGRHVGLALPESAFASSRRGTHRPPPVDPLRSRSQYAKVVEPFEAAAMLAAAHASRVTTIDVSSAVSWTGAFVIGTARSSAHAAALAGAALAFFEEKRSKAAAAGDDKAAQMKPSVEGSPRGGRAAAESPDWLVVDMDSVVVHIFSAAARREYDLETLWGKEHGCPVVFFENMQAAHEKAIADGTAAAARPPAAFFPTRLSHEWAADEAAEGDTYFAKAMRLLSPRETLAASAHAMMHPAFAVNAFAAAAAAAAARAAAARAAAASEPDVGSDDEYDDDGDGGGGGGGGGGKGGAFLPNDDDGDDGFSSEDEASVQAAVARALEEKALAAELAYASENADGWHPLVYNHRTGTFSRFGATGEGGRAAAAAVAVSDASSSDAGGGGDSDGGSEGDDVDALWERGPGGADLGGGESEAARASRRAALERYEHVFRIDAARDAAAEASLEAKWAAAAAAAAAARRAAKGATAAARAARSSLSTSPGTSVYQEDQPRAPKAATRWRALSSAAAVGLEYAGSTTGRHSPACACAACVAVRAALDAAAPAPPAPRSAGALAFSRAPVGAAAHPCAPGCECSRCEWVRWRAARIGAMSPAGAAAIGVAHRRRGRRTREEALAIAARAAAARGSDEGGAAGARRQKEAGAVARC